MAVIWQISRSRANVAGMVLFLLGAALANARGDSPATAPSTSPDAAATQPHRLTMDELLSPSVITLNYDNAPLSDVLADFARQCNADLGLRRPHIAAYAKGKQITIHLDHVSFWEAMRRICDLTALHAQLYPPTSHLMLDTNTIGGGMNITSDLLSVCGPVAVIPQNCSVFRSVNYPQGDVVASNMTLMTMVAAEPKLRLCPTPGDTVQIDQCVDEKGQSLLITGGATPMISSGQQWFWQMQQQLREVPGVGRKIAKMKGTLKFGVELKSETREIDAVMDAKDASRTIGDATLTIKQVVNNNNQIQIMLSVKYATPRQTDMPPRFEMLNDQGEQEMQNGTAATGSGDGRFDYTIFLNPFDFQGHPLGAPRKLIWEVSTEQKQVTVPFELLNLDLPRAAGN